MELITVIYLTSLVVGSFAYWSNLEATDLAGQLTKLSGFAATVFGLFGTIGVLIGA